MGCIIECIVEIFAEIIFESAADAAESPKIPKWIRLIIISVVFAIPITVSTILMISSYNSNDELGILFVITVIEVLLVGLWIFLCCKILFCKPKPKDKNDT